MTSWCRLWHDMPTDPKWRAIARRSGQRIGDVIALFNMLLVEASQAEDRGSVAGFDAEDAAAALDMEVEQVAAVLVAMDGKVIENGRLSGWDRRQPKREDGAAERAKAWRERNRTQPNASNETANAPNAEPNAQKRPDTDTDTDTDTEVKKEKNSVPNGTAADAPTDLDFDPKKMLWGAGLRWYAETIGTTVEKARPQIGRWLKAHGDDAAKVLSIMQECKDKNPISPRDWLEGAMKPKSRAEVVERYDWRKDPAYRGSI